MNVFGKSFEYDGMESDNFNVMLCSFGDSDTTRSTAISYDILSGEITPKRPIPNFYNKKYNKVLEFQIEICKCPESEEFTEEDQKNIIRWLTSPIEYKKFKIIDYKDSNYHTGVEYYCLCTDYSETVINDSIYGMKFHFKCNAPYGFYEEQVIDFSSTASNPSTFIVPNISDEIYEDFYPIITLKASENCNVTISNSIYPNEVMELKMHAGQILNIDNGISDISDNFDMFNYNTDTNLCWLRLANGANVITVTGSVTGQIKCSYPRKAGI